VTTEATAVRTNALRRQPLSKRAGKLIPYLFVAPTVLVLMFLILYPIVQVFYMSVWDNYFVAPTPRFVGLDNYKWLFQQDVFGRIFSNTVLFTVGSVALHLIFGLGLAVLLSSRINERARGVFRGVLLMPWTFTLVVVSVIWRLILNPFGLLNGLLSAVGLVHLAAPPNWLGDPNIALPAIILINFWAGYPFVMLMLLAAMQSVPAELYEAATVDGAGEWGKFFFVAIPTIRPVIASVSLLDAIWSFRLFDLVYLTTGGGPLNATHVLATYNYQLAFEGFQFSRSAALSVILLACTSVMALFYFRFQKA
jgi:multiple sugar transport system permease protein